ncbi:MAG TPA: hypothetical protein VKA46_27415 [Gemmataceae bacterium]|nr:hypothetical protein [Gemmataceae bacterium]
MEVQYILKADDVLACLKYHGMSPPPIVSRRSKALMVLLIIGGAILLEYFGVRGAIAVFVLALAVSLSVWRCTRSALKDFRLQQHVKRGGYSEWLGLYQVNINSEVLIVVREGRASLTKWAEVRGIHRVGGNAFFYLPDSTVLILPQRPFESNEAFEEYVAAAQGFRKAARRASAMRTDKGVAPRADDTAFMPDDRIGR